MTYIIINILSECKKIAYNTKPMDLDQCYPKNFPENNILFIKYSTKRLGRYWFLTLKNTACFIDKGGILQKNSFLWIFSFSLDSSIRKTNKLLFSK